MLQSWSHFSFVLLIGLQSCSDKHWRNIVQWIEPAVTDLAMTSCKAVRLAVTQRGDSTKWIASYDGFYLTRGHHSNNSSATLHDYDTGKVAWFEHRTKRGRGHNWDGTSGAAESDMLDHILRDVKEAGWLQSNRDRDRQGQFCQIHLPSVFPRGPSDILQQPLHEDPS